MGLQKKLFHWPPAVYEKYTCAMFLDNIQGLLTNSYLLLAEMKMWLAILSFEWLLFGLQLPRNNCIQGYSCEEPNDLKFKFN